MITPEPVKPLNFRIGAFAILDPEIQVGFTQRVIPFKYRVIFDHLLGSSTSMGEIPGVFIGIDVVFNMLDISTPFEHNSFQSLFCQFFCGPSTADSGANHDGIISI
jgi:hypothetical protein